MTDFGDYLFRMSSDADKEAISCLLDSCFGAYPKKVRGALDNLDGRYMLVEHISSDKLTLVSMAGITDGTYFNGYELDWACTAPAFQKKRLMTELLSRLLKSLPEDGRPVYCTCWRFGWNETGNMSTVMSRLGAEEVIVGMEKALADTRRECNDCRHRQIPYCWCYTDLYRIDRKL